MPVWALWALGGAVLGAAGYAADQVGDAIEQTGTAFEKAARWAVAGMAIYFALQLLKGRG